MAKRVSSSAVNWSRIMEYLADTDKKFLIAFKGTSDKYLREVASHPAELPKIDWTYYKSRVSTAGLVDSFQKNYEQLKIPYPSDKGLVSKVEGEVAQLVKGAIKIDEETAKKLEDYKTKLKTLEALIPASEMSMEELAIAFPEYKFDPEKPKLWPQFMDTEYPENLEEIEKPKGDH